MTWLLALWVQTAAASPVVLHQGDEDAVRSAVADAANVAPGTLSMTNFDVFRSTTAPKWSGQIELTPCAGDRVSMKQIADDVAAAESRLMYMELDKANTGLVSAQEKLVCVDSVLDASVVARIGFLRGVISTEGEKGNDAWKSFTFAARFDPAIEWDDQYPTDGRGTLVGAKEALASSDRIDVGVVPSFSATEDSSQLFLNAQPVTAQRDRFTAAPGTNLLQLQTDDGVVGFNVEVEAETRPDLFLPQLLRSDSLSQMSSEEGRKDFITVINRAYDPGTLVYVAHEDGIWRTASGMDRWDTLRVPTGATAGGGISAMAWVGTGLSAGALAGTIFAIVKANQQLKAPYPSGGNGADQHAQTGDVAKANQMHNEWIKDRQSVVGWSVGAGVGAALTATGIIFTVPMF